MASQVFSGTDQPSFTYTNNTGQNVRVVINFLRVNTSSSPGANSFSISAGGLSLTYGGGTTSLNFTVGRNLAFYKYVKTSGGVGVAVAVAGNNAYGDAIGESIEDAVDGVPTELMLSSGQVFTLGGGRLAYNIVVIPEAG